MVRCQLTDLAQSTKLETMTGLLNEGRVPMIVQGGQLGMRGQFLPVVLKGHTE